MKKNNIPPKTNGIIRCGSPVLSIASGIKPNKDAVSKTPIA
ncbi:MAG: hypothetical protein WBH31_07990 [Promethearchaeia archaeon]